MMPLAMLPARPSASTGWPASSFMAAHDAGYRGDRAEHAGRVKPGLVNEPRCNKAQAADGLDPDADAEKRRAPIEAETLGSSQDRWDYHGAGMHGAALERVVEILAMRGDAVDECGARGVAGSGVADDGATALAVGAGAGGLDVIGAARGET